MKNCICGEVQYEPVTHEYCTVTPDGSLEYHNNTDVKFGKCTNCGIVRQLNLPYSNDEEYAAYYQAYPPTSAVYGAKGWRHDLELAKKRCDAYEITAGSENRVLDIGSGSGAFVVECRNRGQAAYGCELAKYEDGRGGDFIYRDSFEDIHFPTDHFNIVTCHDVLEHALSPVRMINEMFRTTKQGGRTIIDFPRFFHETGRHHWKDGEHVWYFNEEQLNGLLVKAGFIVTNVQHPIESKSVFHCVKPEQKRPTILVPPGIGDSYWSIVKMQSFIAREGISIPEVTPVSNREGQFQGHARSIPFIDMFPFMHASGVTIANDPRLRNVWHEAYSIPGRTVFRGLLDTYDYFLSYNGHLRVGAQLEQVDPDLACNWHPPMFVSIEQENFKQHCLEKYKRYIVCYFPFYGTYSYWTKQFPMSAVVQSLIDIAERTGCTIIITGAQWDAADSGTRYLINNIPGCVDMTGQTNLAQLFGMLRGAEAILGYPSGLTIMAAVLGKKTLIIWNTYYNHDFAWYCAPPDTRAVNYFIDFTEGLSGARLVGEMTSLVETGTINPEQFPSNVQASEKYNPSNRVGPPAKLVGPPPPLRTSVNIPAFPTIVCVLKTGGDYDVGYVQKLNNSIARNVTIPYQFICLTNLSSIDGIVTHKLVSNYDGWWNKLELFRENQFVGENIVYFDLDTVIISNIDDIVGMKVSFAGLGAWNPVPERAAWQHFGSGMMMWHNNGIDYKFLYDEHDPSKVWRYGDQEYIAKSLLGRGIQYKILQDIVSGVYSYKRNCASMLPSDARIICFHGHPRPHEVAGRVKWVRNNWK